MAIDESEELVVDDTKENGIAIVKKRSLNKKYGPYRECCCKHGSCERFLVVPTELGPPGLGDDSVTVCEGAILAAAMYFKSTK